MTPARAFFVVPPSRALRAVWCIRPHSASRQNLHADAVGNALRVQIAERLVVVVSMSRAGRIPCGREPLGMRHQREPIARVVTAARLAGLRAHEERCWSITMPLQGPLDRRDAHAGPPRDGGIGKKTVERSHRRINAHRPNHHEDDQAFSGGVGRSSAFREESIQGKEQR